MIGQTAEIAPADKRLYALRDATATVESIPLISASIMSKKLAEGIDGLVLDVKTGDGAFLERLDDSRKLAESMCAIGRELGKRMRALITRMDQPLGRAVGNAVEVAEMRRVPPGDGGRRPADLVDLSVELAAEMVVMGERAADRSRGTDTMPADDRGRLGIRAVPPARGGARGRSPGHRRSVPPPPPRRRNRRRGPASGIVQALAARPIGHATMLLGAGRARVDSTIDPAVGVIVHKKVGDRVERGRTTLHGSDQRRIRPGSGTGDDPRAYRIGDEAVAVPELAWSGWTELMPAVPTPIAALETPTLASWCTRSGSEATLLPTAITLDYPDSPWGKHYQGVEQAMCWGSARAAEPPRAGTRCFRSTNACGVRRITLW